MGVVRTVGCLLLMGANVLFADPFDEGIPDAATPVSLDLAAWCDVAGQRFVFEKTPLADVITTLGGGKLQRTGDAGAAVFDYYVDFTDGTRLIRFSSNNDMGGEDHALQGVTISPLTLSGRAGKLPHLQLPIHFPFGSSAVSFSDLERKLGPAVLHHGVCAYIFTAKIQGKDYNGASMTGDVQATLEVRTFNEKIVAMDVHRVTSF